jgi:hypothetical protein
VSLSEAQAAIILSAVSGGMYEIGDDLPMLGAEKDRLDLVKNQDLLNMAKLSRAATPIDLLSYEGEDGEPSIFFLREDPRQSILAVFNWTEQPRTHSIRMADLGLPANHRWKAFDVLNGGESVALSGGSIQLAGLPPHSVRTIKLIDSTIPAAAPTVAATAPGEVHVGEPLPFSVRPDDTGVPALSYHWDFRDGTNSDAARGTHTYTRAAAFTIRVTVEGLDGIAAHHSFPIKVTGTLTAPPDVLQNQRYTDRGGR